MPKATTKTEAKAATPVLVPASVSSAVSAFLASDTQVLAATQAREQKWMRLATVLVGEFDDKNEAKACLAEAFKSATTDENKMRLGEYRSKILGLAFPKEEANLAQAVKEKLPTLKLLLAASGKLAPAKKKNKDGTTNWIKVEGSGGRQGGSNRVAPLDKAKLDMALLFTHIKTAKLDEDQVAVMIAEQFAEANEMPFDLETLIKALSKNL